MDQNRLKNLLGDLQAGRVDLPTAVAQLEKLPFEDIGYAKIDHHRCCRTGVSEVIYCEGKTLSQIQGIVTRLAAGHDNILATRAAPEVHAAVREVAPDCSYHETARIVVVKPRPLSPIGNIAVLCAGTSDIPVAEEAAVTAEVLGSRVARIYDVGVAGIHRLLDKREQLGRANVAVVVAGMEGALTSVVGGLVPYPVIGVPTSIGYGASFGGLAALLAMLNSCAAGVSVVNIDNGFGAGCQAALINRLAVCGTPESETAGDHDG
jgi:NCAIR mutase (PurE)-related protein